MIYYYLEDDTMCIIEPTVENSGIPQGKRLKRQRFPNNERGEHYQWKDLNLGMDLEVYGVKYHITQCDPFTKVQHLYASLNNMPLYLGVCCCKYTSCLCLTSSEQEFMESEGIVLNEPEPMPEDPYSRRNKPNLELSHTTTSTFDKLYQFLHMDRKEIPPYNGFGSLEDSLQNCLSLIPEPPKVNVVKRIENDHKVLRYTAQLDSPYSKDEGRRFILSYHLSNDMISIFEKPMRNSGIIGGKFLEKTRIPKPGSSVDNPEFYSPADFAIGATVDGNPNFSLKRLHSY
ncbi:hypothetical protein XENOCAPTIV_003710 [Xenoophorus captivus]|uniref:DM10 domain-containing protein n=1 Tax=Xenoophorus captivus TaxID=1517983 RepID=A0ABV0QCM0_9TELE